jgi:hypothetical protein
MNKLLLYVPANLSRLLFGLWLVGMGVMDYIRPGSPSLQTLMGIVLGVILVGAGVCTLIGR